MVLNHGYFNQRRFNQLLTQRYIASDIASFAESVQKGIQRVIADILHVTDDVTRKIKRFMADTVSFTESLRRSATKVLADTLSFTEGITRSVNKKLTDTVSFTETILKSASVHVAETFRTIDQLIVREVLPTVIAMFDVITISDYIHQSGVLNHISHIPQMILAKVGLAKPVADSQATKPFAFSKPGIKPRGV